MCWKYTIDIGINMSKIKVIVILIEKSKLPLFEEVFVEGRPECLSWPVRHWRPVQSASHLSATDSWS